MKDKKSFISGVAYVVASANNVRVTITDHQGNVRGWSTSGCVGFRGNKKSTVYAASCVMNSIIGKMKRFGLKILDFHLEGAYQIRDAAVRTAKSAGITPVSVRSSTTEPHGGTRLRRRPRS